MSNELGNGAMTDNPFLMPADVYSLRDSIRQLTRSVDQLDRTMQLAVRILAEHERVVQFDASMVARFEALEAKQSPARSPRKKGK